MSGSDSYIGNAGVSIPHMADVTGTAMYAPPPMAVVAPAAMYAPLPMVVVAPPNSSEPPSHTPPAATFQPDTGVSRDSAVAVEAVVQLPIANSNGNNSGGEVIKRKRGRPRKYAPPEGSPLLTSSPPPVQSGGFAAAPAVAMAAQASSGKARGRPLGSGSGSGSGRKKQKKVVAPAVSGSAGTGLTAHVITVKPGEDVLVKVMSVFQNNTRAICVLSANGVISNVTLRRAATSGGTVTIEGRFEILTLSGTFLIIESGGQTRRAGGLNVSLAGPDGNVLGGGVAGLLTAASPIQVVATSFIPEGQQATYLGNREVYHALPNLASGASMVGSPPSRATQSGSSGGPGSPLNYSTGGCYNNNPQTFANVGWR